MDENRKQPKDTDAVLGGQTAPKRGLVLGGIEGLRKRLKSSDQKERLVGLQQVSNYGNQGLQIVKEPEIREKVKITQKLENIKLSLENCLDQINEPNYCPMKEDLVKQEEKESLIQELSRQNIIDHSFLYLKETVDSLFASHTQLQDLLTYIKQLTQKLSHKDHWSAVRTFYVFLVEDVYCRNTFDRFLALQRVQAYELGLKLSHQESLELVYYFDSKYFNRWNPDPKFYSINEICQEYADMFLGGALLELDNFYELLQYTQILPFFDDYLFDLDDENQLANSKWWYPPACMTEGNGLANLLRLYTIANEFFIDHLNAPSGLSEPMQKKIKETLFIPAKEI